MKKIVSHEPNILTLDIGFIVGPDEPKRVRKAEVSLSILEKLGIHTMALAGYDFQLGSDFWLKKAESSKIAFITSNLVNSETGETFFKPYHILEIAGIKIGILSAMPETAFAGIPKDMTLRPYDVAAPEETISKLVAELRDQTDVIILLSHLTPDRTLEILKSNQELDMGICRHADMGFGQDDSYKGIPQRLLFVGTEGTELGYYRLGFNETKEIVAEGGKTFTLDDKAAKDSEISAILDTEFPE